METGILSLLASALGGLGNYFGGQSQSDSAEEQRKQAENMMQQENQLRSDSAQYLRSIMPNFDFNMPDANKYFGTEGINKQYDIGRANLNFGMNQAVNDASAQAGALGASRGFANPSGFVSNSANQVRQSYFPQFGALEQQRAGALQGNQANLFQALMAQMNQSNQLKQNQFQNQFNVSQHRIGG